MWLTRLAISRPILIWMALAAIAVLGLQAYLRLPAELNPRVDIPTLTVTTVYPGAGPPEVETQISKPLEDAVGTVAGVQQVYSSSQANVSILSIDFRVGTNLDVAAADVRARVEAVRAQLPTGAEPPVVAKLDINALPILYFGLESPSRTLQQLRALVENTLVPRLERVPGVGTVQVVGGEEREIHVAVDTQRLAQFGLTIEDVVNSIKASGRDIPAGSIQASGRETDVRLAASYTSLDALRNTQILAPQLAAQSSQGPGGGASALPAPPLTVADVATVTAGNAERTTINRINGQEGVSVVLTKSPDANTVTVVDEVNAALRQALPADVKRVDLRDDSVTVRSALEDVDTSLVLGAILAMGVILLFLHNLRGTLIVSLAIPACIVATFLVMWLFGFTLNQMTLLALSLSVGILVDDSIVVLESITRHLSQGEPPIEAAFNGRTEIGFAGVAITLVDVVVFVPIAFMGGIVGSFFKQFGLTIVAATLFSLVVSFTVTPMLASRWYRPGEQLESGQGFFAPLERLYRGLERLYRRVIRWALRWRWVVIVTGVLALGLTAFLAFSRLGTELLPGTDQGQITINIEMPPGTSLAATDAAARRVEQRIAGTPDVEATVTNVGQVLGGFGSIPQQGAQFAQINVRLKDKSGLLERLLHPVSARTATRTRSDQDIATQIRARLQPVTQEIGGVVHTAAVRSVIGISAPVEIQLRGSDTDQLAQMAAQVRTLLTHIPGVLDPDVSVRSGKPEVYVAIDRQRAAQFSIAPGQAGAILRDSIAGNTDTIFLEDGQEVPIRIGLEDVQRDDPQNVGGIVVGSDAQGQPVTLSDVAHIALRTGPTDIDRTNGQRTVTVTAALASDTPLGSVRALVDRQIATIPHPGIVVHWSGDIQTLDQNVIPFVSALGMAVILVYIVMASLFNALGTPFVVMFSLPMALVGALGALVLTGQTLSLVSAIGIIMLVGLMGRNAILLLDYTNTLRARGLERNAAIMEAGTTRLRPILMTSIATIVGMLPVALRIGRASEIRAPMAIVVIGGLLVSTVLTLVVIPVVYSLFDDWSRGRKRDRTASQPPTEPDESKASTESIASPTPPPEARPAELQEAPPSVRHYGTEGEGTTQHLRS
jgi:HAE1 family hydrophobic/amphiphilic exporter-1